MEEIKKEETTETSTEPVKVPTKKKKLIKLFSIIFIIMTLIALIIYKIINPEFQLRTIILIGLALVVIGLLGLFSAEILSFFKSKEKKAEEEVLPKPKAQDEMIEIAKNLIEKPRIEGGFENHIKFITDRRSMTSGGNQMFSMRIIPLYIDRDEFTKKMITSINFMFNSQDALHPSVDFNLEDKAMTSQAARMSKNPESKDVEERVETDLSTGRESRYRRVSHHKKLPKKEESEI